MIELYAHLAELTERAAARAEGGEHEEALHLLEERARVTTRLSEPAPPAARTHLERALAAERRAEAALATAAGDLRRRLSGLQGTRGYAAGAGGVRPQLDTRG